MKIPKSLHQYFWDVNVEKLDPKKKPYFVISRLLDKGNIEAIKWVRHNYQEDEIKETFRKIRDFNTKAGRFWSLFLKVPEEEIACLQPSYLKTRRMHWPY